ncbi:MAG: TonB family protein, partial [Chlorobi bacterium]|nr:TonB family protein [Chlorobiota bacterium]
PISGPQGTTITSGYGMRIHPVYKTRKFHFGVDLKAQKGTPVLATAGGTVTRAKPNGKFGNEVRILHSGNLESRYDHLDQIKVTEGQKVKQGEVIGTVGNSGLPSSDPHLHFALLKNGKFVDPASYINFRDIVGDQSKILSIQRSKNNGEVSPEQDTTQGDIFFIVEEMPGFQGGDENRFREWIAENLRYPEEAKRQGIEGKVYIRFIVEADGRVSNVEVIRTADPLLDAEAVRVVRSSPTWTPGKQRGHNVRVAYTFPITFTLDKTPREALRDTTNGEVFFIVEEMPRFQGGDISTFRQWVADHLEYPVVAAEKGIGGRVFVRFIVQPDGHVGHVSVVRGVDSLLDQEAKRVVSASPAWTPGKQRGKNVAVAYTFPIVFVMEEKDKPYISSSNLAKEQNVVYIIDGKKATFEDIRKLDPNNIGGVKVIAGKEAAGQYGNKNKDGVILISTINWIPGKTPPKPAKPDRKVTRNPENDELILEDIPQNQDKESNTETFFIVEEMPKFQGGDVEKFRQYIADNIVYPESAASRGVSGKVFVQWIVDNHGNVTDVKVVRGVDPDLDAEAVRVVSSSPRWTPGRQRGITVRVQMTTPIVFVLDHGNEPASGIHYQKPGQKILYFIDGRKATEEEVKKLNADSIKNVSSISGKEAAIWYGDKAKDGVIFISTREPVPIPKIEAPAPPKPPFDKSAGYLYLINGEKTTWKKAVKYQKNKNARITVLTHPTDYLKTKFGKKAANGIVDIRIKEK